MGNGDNGRCVFPLTSLQIGDLQSYLSHLALFLAPDSRKLFILVDNRPWLKDLVSKPTHFWQLMVTKSRMSPFANTRRSKVKKVTGAFSELPASSRSNSGKSEKLKKWLSLIDAFTSSRKRALLPVKKLRNSLIINSKLHRTLYGFIVFEVAWSNVRGINYLNELQTDTSLAIEAKSMRRWEFDSIEQAIECMSSWFPGTYNEQTLLKAYLNSTIGDIFHDAQDNFPRTTNADDNVDLDDSFFYPSCSTVYPEYMDDTNLGLHTPPPPNVPYKRRKVMKNVHSDDDIDIYSQEIDTESVQTPIRSPTSCASDCEDLVEATHYEDVLISLRFNDRDLPFKLRDIIMSDLRLLTLLESGLPSWVIFVQSYPLFCHLYRPWMCPLARALYVLISIVTVLIGFYDLYKNVPVLKATAAGLFGPLFDWIETWEMISRIKYLGTMLFLHNFQKAVQWFLMIARTTRSFFSILPQPMVRPLVELLELFLPLWSMCIQVAESIFSVIWIMVESSCTVTGQFVDILLLPLWYALSLLWSTATSIIYPVFWIFWEILYAPFRVILGLCSLLTFIFSSTYELVGDVCMFVSSIFQFTSNVESTVSSYEFSMWHSLWNDLFSQIFRALRSILNGFVAFFTACNRHRLSIYNHAKEFNRRLSGPAKRTESQGNRHRTGAQKPEFHATVSSSVHKRELNKD